MIASKEIQLEEAKGRSENCEFLDFSIVHKLTKLSREAARTLSFILLRFFETNFHCSFIGSFHDSFGLFAET